MVVVDGGIPTFQFPSNPDWDSPCWTTIRGGTQVCGQEHADCQRICDGYWFPAECREDCQDRRICCRKDLDIKIAECLVAMGGNLDDDQPSDLQEEIDRIERERRSLGCNRMPPPPTPRGPITPEPYRPPTNGVDPRPWGWGPK